MGEKACRIIDLLVASFLSLFFEILVIRWLAAEIRIFAYFANLPLISSFLGLGIGFSLAKSRRNLLPYFPFLVAIFVVVVYLSVRGPLEDLRYVGLSEVFIWGFREPGTLRAALKFYLVIAFFFTFIVLIFTSLGQAVGRCMGFFAPLPAYTANIAASIGGLVAFSAVSSLWLRPVLWFGIALILALYLLHQSRLQLILGAACAILTLAILYVGDDAAIWSPYYKITLKPLYKDSTAGGRVFFGYDLAVNKDYHQSALNLSNEFTRSYPDLFKGVAYNIYNLPYLFIKPAEVLVVGSGLGNDVAAALRHGAQKVTAVEIDPAILHLGRDLHPEAPYNSQKVTSVVDDARSFFKKSKDRYDLIVFGFLDSHTLFSTISDIRLDNYVYTIESFGEAKRLLKENGAIALAFSLGAGRKWIGDRFNLMLAQLFGKEPLQLDMGENTGMLFIAGPGADYKKIFSLPDLSPFVVDNQHKPARPAIIATDDWPFLYLRDKGIPRSYVSTLLTLIILSAAILLLFSGGRARLDLHFFFLGFAFLLVETRGIAALALLYGSTWVVNSVTILAILAMILLANLYALKVEVKRLAPYYALLALSLLLNFFFPLGRFLESGPAMRTLSSGLMVSLPVFFAGVIFANSFKKTPHMEVALSSNLLGSVAGGFFEYTSLAFGVRSLSMFAILIYAASFAALRAKR